MVDPIAQRVICVGLIGILLTFSRRWRNEDPKAGLGVAGWTITIIFFITT